MFRGFISVTLSMCTENVSWAHDSITYFKWGNSCFWEFLVLKKLRNSFCFLAVQTCVYLDYILKWNISIMLVYFLGFDSSLSLDVVSVKLGAAHQKQTVLFWMNIYVDVVIRFHFFFVYQRTKEEWFNYTTFYLLLAFFFSGLQG